MFVHFLIKNEEVIYWNYRAFDDWPQVREDKSDIRVPAIDSCLSGRTVLCKMGHKCVDLVMRPSPL